MEMGWIMNSIKIVGIRSKSILLKSLLHRPPGTNPGQATQVSPQNPRIGMRDKPQNWCCGTRLPEGDVFRPGLAVFADALETESGGFVEAGGHLTDLA